MEQIFLRITKPFWPELAEMPETRRLVGIGDVLTSLYSSLIAITGIWWLSTVTNFNIIVDNWPMLLILGGLIIVFERLNFFMIIEFREDRYGSADGTFNSMMVWVAAFLFGPTALWLMILIQLFQFFSLWHTFQNNSSKWNNIRNLMLTLSGFTIPYLAGLKVFELMGGSYPLPTLTSDLLIAGFMGIIVNFLVFALIWTPYFLFALYTQRKLSRTANPQPIFLFFILALSLPTVAHPFAILAAGLYTIGGLLVFLFFIVGLIVVAYLARQFSWIAESNRQQSRQLEKLESLGRAFLQAPPDGTALKDILAEHIPNMFPAGNMSIWLIPGQRLYQSADWDTEFRPIWDFVDTLSEAAAFLPEDILPWEKEIHEPHRPIIVAPIIAQNGDEVIGGVYLELRRLAQPWDMPALKKLFPGIHSLADQVSSTINQAEEYVQSLALDKVSQELQIAGQIQTSFLPNEFPNIPNYQLAVSLEPAGGLSGDFFDFIPLSRGRLGIVIADVADKGLGAALYMALCRTLLRTYAFEYHSRPDIVLSETNDRILSDARANLFITAFYGVLDPVNNTLTYCNAGHNPPYLIHQDQAREPEALIRTGMPIGIEEDTRWAREVITFEPGDSLILYTDGVTDAQNNEQEFFDDDRLLAAALEIEEPSAFELQANILERIKEFTDGAQQFDDITLMLLTRDTISEESEE